MTKERTTAGVSSSLGDVDPQQLGIYAREVHEAFVRESRLRRRVKHLEAEVDSREREVMALNVLLQQHLQERFALAHEYLQVLQGVRALLRARGTQPDPYGDHLAALLNQAGIPEPEAVEPAAPSSS